MEEDLLTPLAIAVLIVLAGLLLYFRPPTTAAARLRVASFVAMFFSLAFLSLGIVMVDMKSGGFFGLVFMPLGTVWTMPHPYDYYLLHLTFPIARVVCLSIAFVCSIAYVSQYHSKPSPDGFCVKSPGYIN